MNRKCCILKGNDLISIRHTLSLLSIYIIVLGLRGFLFSSNDLVDVMSYAKFLSNPELYPFDFYIQHLHKAFPNERWIFSGFLALSGDNIRWLSLPFHAITSLFLFAGIFKVSTLYTENEFLRWLPVLLITGPLYGLNPGACDIYYNMFISSLTAKSIGVWALYFFLKKKTGPSYLLLIPATLIHPTVGAQLFLIVTAASVFLWKTTHRKSFFQGFSAYLLTAGVYIVLLQLKMNANSSIRPEELFEIFEFRIAHHFFPSYFPRLTYLLAFILWGFGFWYFIRIKARQMLVFLAVTLAGMIFYSIFTEVLPVSSVLSTQWFKTSIWIQLSSVIALLAWFEQVWKKSFFNRMLNWPMSGIFPLTAVLVVILSFGGHPFFSEKKYEFFFNDDHSDEAEIALLAKKHTPEDAVFVVPMSFTEFKYFSERSLYIDYKSVVHRKDALDKWYERIRTVYGIDVQNRRNGQDLYAAGYKNYTAMDVSGIEKLKGMNIAYFVTYAHHKLPYTKIAVNKSFIIYDLNTRS